MTCLFYRKDRTRRGFVNQDVATTVTPMRPALIGGRANVDAPYKAHSFGAGLGELQRFLVFKGTIALSPVVSHTDWTIDRDRSRNGVKHVGGASCSGIPVYRVSDRGHTVFHLCRR